MQIYSLRTYKSPFSKSTRLNYVHLHLKLQKCFNKLYILCEIRIRRCSIPNWIECVWRKKNGIACKNVLFCCTQIFIWHLARSCLLYKYTTSKVIHMLVNTYFLLAGAMNSNVNCCLLRAVGFILCTICSVMDFFRVPMFRFQMIY